MPTCCRAASISITAITYSGHPVSCAVGIENIRILKDEKLVERVKNETGPYLATRLKELLDHPLVGEVRNVGLMGAIELVKDKKTRKTFEPVGEVGTICRDHCFANGLVMRATRDTMMLSPPLTWTKARHRRVHAARDHRARPDGEGCRKEIRAYAIGPGEHARSD